MRRFNFVLAVVVSLLLGFGTVAMAGGVGFGKFKKPVKKCYFTVDPGVFIGKAGDCGTDPGNPIVAADWENGFGLPENDGIAQPYCHDNQALLLSKDGLTSDCSSAGAEIKGVKGITLTELGFDIRNGGHCGAGAPRFNVVATDGFHFLGGCANGTKTADTPALGWTRVRIDPANAGQAFPPIATGATIISIEIVFDEGVDTGPDLSGFAILDNIDVNGILLGDDDPVEVPCIPPVS